MMQNKKDYLLESYRYDLPEQNIAQYPADKRDHSKLLVLNRKRETLEIADFRDILDFVPKNALLVANNSMVLPARLYGRKHTGGKVEFLLLTPLPLVKPEKGENGYFKAEVKCLLRASKGPKGGERIEFGPNHYLVVAKRGEFGRSIAMLHWKGELADLFTQKGHMPLPPYIRREDEEQDESRYQTVYANKEKAGSVAAPTAGLHFTDELRSEIRARGIEWAEVTLYVGYGTFSPVRCTDIREHVMHEEFVEVSESTALALKKAKAEKRPVIAIGTTSARTLEGMHKELGGIGPYSGMTNIFIRPGYRFRVVDHLLTNFHLPESSLLIMVSSLAGRKTVLKGYKYALKNGFRFFSYGDAMFIV